MNVSSISAHLTPPALEIARSIGAGAVRRISTCLIRAASASAASGRGPASRASAIAAGVRPARRSRVEVDSPWRRRRRAASAATPRSGLRSIDQRRAAVALDRVAQGGGQGVDRAALDAVAVDHRFAAHRSSRVRERDRLQRRAGEAVGQMRRPGDAKAAIGGLERRDFDARSRRASRPSRRPPPTAATRRRRAPARPPRPSPPPRRPVRRSAGGRRARGR